MISLLTGWGWTKTRPHIIKIKTVQEIAFFFKLEHFNGTALTKMLLWSDFAVTSIHKKKLVYILVKINASIFSYGVIDSKN